MEGRFLEICRMAKKMPNFTSLASAAIHADAKQTEFCTYLSAILLGGLVLNAVFGLWFADPLAALLMAPIILHEGVQGLVLCSSGTKTI
jgi:divalent metal cation (Fe/Co/Zn/Cd) transporter